MTKVLVFESDHAFAGELRTELSRLGCVVSVVDDGNVGLQTASSDPPNLILLSIELPRMNGFSVCNKLKKDPTLKDVPLIIMSSESSDDTFEQHKKLRTRAEDYVHKPIALGELLEHIRRFVTIGAGEAEGEPIVIDDAIELMDDDNESTNLGGPGAGATDAPPPRGGPPSAPPQAAEAAAPRSVRPAKAEDHEIDDFLGGAFDRLLGDDETAVGAPGEVAPTQAASPSPPAAARGPSVPAPPTDVKRSVPPPAPPARGKSVAPAPPPGAVTGSAASDELERLRAEVARAKDDSARAARELSNAKATILRLEGEAASGGDAGEVERLTREVDDLKHRLTQAASSGKGGVSSKEFLDLREHLNKKDKELLGLRQEMSRKDKELIDLRDQNLSLEREKADQVDRLLEIERAKNDMEALADSLRADKELAHKRGEEFRQKLEKSTQTLNAREAELAGLKQSFAEAEASLRAENAATKASSEEALHQAHNDSEARLAREKSDGEAKVEAIRAQKDKERTDLEESHKNALENARADRERALAEAREAAAQELLASERALEQKRESALSEQRAAHQRASEDVANEHAGQRERLETTIAETKARLAESEAKAADTESKRAALAAELGETQKKLTAMEAKARELEGSLEIRGAELDEAVTEKGQLTSQLQQRTADLTKSREQAESAAERILELEASLKGRTEDLEAKLAVKSSELEKALADIDSLNGALGNERTRLEKARVKWGEDRASLDRAKEALSAAIARITETEQRPLED